MRILFIAITAVLVAAASPTLAQAPAKPLFASHDMLRITIRAPVGALVRNAPSRPKRDGTLTIAGSSEAHPVRVSTRGITRLKRDVCQFPPLRIDFTAPPPAASPFAGQRRLKLVTHCRTAESFQQNLSREYAAYRLYNLLTPASFRVRLAMIDYVEPDGRPLTSRLGFFLEEHRDVAERNGMHRANVGERVPLASLSARDGARLAMFEYMIGNLDWAIRAGPSGERCCHNSRLLARSPSAVQGLVPVPYDFDFSGFVDAPYSTPPDIVPVASVRTRHYRGHCAHNGEALAVARDLRGKRGALLAVLGDVPTMDPRSREKAARYLEGFFADIETDGRVTSKLLRTCVP